MSVIDLIIEEQDYLIENSYTFYLLTRNWQSYNLSDSFAWESHPFQKDQLKHIPSESGIYSFVIQPAIALYPACSYLMYIGLTGCLRKRFSDYLYEQNNPFGRPKILRLLNKYKGYLHFCYSIVNERERLKEIEDALIKAFYPPCNDKYPVELNRAKGAF